MTPAEALDLLAGRAETFDPYVQRLRDAIAPQASAAWAPAGEGQSTTARSSAPAKPSPVISCDQRARCAWLTDWSIAMRSAIS